MSDNDLEIATQFLAALALAAQTGDRDAIVPLLAEDVEWLVPARGLHGLDQVRTALTWVRPPDHLEVEFGEHPLTDAGDGRVTTEVRETYRVRGTGEFAYTRARHIELAIRDGKVARYEMRVIG